MLYKDKHGNFWLPDHVEELSEWEKAELRLRTISERGDWDDGY